MGIVYYFPTYGKKDKNKCAQSMARLPISNEPWDTSFHWIKWAPEQYNMRKNSLDLKTEFCFK